MTEHLTPGVHPTHCERVSCLNMWLCYVGGNSLVQKVLEEWLQENVLNPYPNQQQKSELCLKANLSYNQVRLKHISPTEIPPTQYSCLRIIFSCILQEALNMSVQTCPHYLLFVENRCET